MQWALNQEELEALPNDSVIIDSMGDVAQRRDGVWCSFETRPMNDRYMARYLPAEVLKVG